MVIVVAIATCVVVRMFFNEGCFVWSAVPVIGIKNVSDGEHDVVSNDHALVVSRYRAFYQFGPD